MLIVTAFSFLLMGIIIVGEKFIDHETEEVSEFAYWKDSAITLNSSGKVRVYNESNDRADNVRSIYYTLSSDELNEAVKLFMIRKVNTQLRYSDIIDVKVLTEDAPKTPVNKPYIILEVSSSRLKDIITDEEGSPQSTGSPD